jgi:hypothetical protein
LSTVARVLLLVGMLASGVIFAGAALYYGYVLRERPRRLGEVRPGGGLVGIIAMIPALVPGLIIGWIAYRLPKRLTLKCSRCTWRGRYRIGRDGYATEVGPISVLAPPERRGEAAAQAAVFDRIDVAPPPAPAPPVKAVVAPAAAPAAAGFAVVDDELPENEADAWAYAEIASGRTPEEIVEEMVGGGWDRAHAEVIAERARKRTRHRRP